MLTWVVAGAGFAGSVAAIALPSSTQTAEIAAVLSLGALALWAGHAWGLAVVVAADIVLLGKLWPLVIYGWPPSMQVQVALYTALAGALPGLWVLPRVLPATVDLLLGRTHAPRIRIPAMAAASALAIACLILPAL